MKERVAGYRHLLWMEAEGAVCGRRVLRFLSVTKQEVWSSSKCKGRQHREGCMPFG